MPSRRKYFKEVTVISSDSIYVQGIQYTYLLDNYIQKTFSNIMLCYMIQLHCEQWTRYGQGFRGLVFRRSFFTSAYLYFYSLAVFVLHRPTALVSRVWDICCIPPFGIIKEWKLLWRLYSDWVKNCRFPAGEKLIVMRLTLTNYYRPTKLNMRGQQHG